ncbi:MAG: hypothetical protein ACTSRG_21850 [Candidatus Helarchaeota archaeon]
MVRLSRTTHFSKELGSKMPKRRKKSSKKSQTNKSKRKNIYAPSRALINSNLELINELNKQLSESIQQIFKEKKEILEEKLSNLDEKTQDELVSSFLELETLLKTIVQTEQRELGGSIEIKMSDEAGDFFIEFIKTYLYRKRFDEFIRTMSLVYLVAIFKSFLQSILTITFQVKPEILSSSKKKVSWEELAKFKNLNEVRKRMMEKEIKSIIDQDIEDIDKYLKNQFKINLSQYPDWNKFKERFYRRNIIIHNLGRIDERYRLKTGYNGEEIRLKIPPEYLIETIELFKTRAERILTYFSKKFE